MYQWRQTRKTSSEMMVLQERIHYPISLIHIRERLLFEAQHRLSLPCISGILASFRHGFISPNSSPAKASNTNFFFLLVFLSKDFVLVFRNARVENACLPLAAEPFFICFGYISKILSSFSSVQSMFSSSSSLFTASWVFLVLCAIAEHMALCLKCYVTLAK